MGMRSVDRYASPGYPTRSVVEEHPELLRLVPKRWRGNPVVLAALTGVCVLLSGCRYDASAAPPKVAPVFLHGHGRGAFGCDVFNPPVFLSEDEARQVVVEEAKKAGIRLAPDAPVLPDILMPAHNVPASDGKVQQQPLVLDGQDSRRKVAYEFISLEDLRAWQEPSRSTVDSYDSLSSARNLRDRLQQSGGRDRVAVFYDPLVRPEMPRDPSGKTDWHSYSKRREELAAEAHRRSQEQLRAQVRDFITWLKAQGVI